MPRRKKRKQAPQDSRRAVTAAQAVLRGGTTQAAEARRHKITRQAVNQAIKRIRAASASLGLHRDAEVRGANR